MVISGGNFRPDTLKPKEVVSLLIDDDELQNKSKNLVHFLFSIFEPPHDKTNNMTCAPSKDSDQPGHPPSLIRVFAVLSMGS